MGLAIDPLDTFEYVLPEDAGKPEEQRRRYTVRYGSCRFWIDYERRYAAAGEAKTSAEEMEGYAACLASALVGVTAEQLLEDLTPPAIAHHARAIAQAAFMSERDAKKSAWRLASPAASSAEAVPQESA